MEIYRCIILEINHSSPGFFFVNSWRKTVNYTLFFLYLKKHPFLPYKRKQALSPSDAKIENGINLGHNNRQPGYFHHRRTCHTFEHRSSRKSTLKPRFYMINCMQTSSSSSFFHKTILSVNYDIESALVLFV